MSETPEPRAEAPSPEKKKKSDLMPRVVTAVVMIPLLILMIFAATHWFWTVFIGAATVVGLYEFFDMTQKEEPSYVKYGSTAIGMLFFLALLFFIGPRPVFALHIHNPEILALGLVSGVVWASFLFHLMRPRNMESVARAIASSIAGVFYIGLAFALIVMMKRDFGPHGGAWVLLLLAACWSSDTGAYFAGKAFGRKFFDRGMAPNVSAKKSIEGGIGGLIATCVAVFVMKLTLLPFLSVADVFLIAVPANFLGQTGDLCESLIKRACGVKDSGTIIHGHGGMLDRVDAVLFAAPYIYLVGFLTGGRALIG